MTDSPRSSRIARLGSEDPSADGADALRARLAAQRETTAQLAEETARCDNKQRSI
jgi:hypothetical protein